MFNRLHSWLQAGSNFWYLRLFRGPRASVRCIKQLLECLPRHEYHIKQTTIRNTDLASQSVFCSSSFLTLPVSLRLAGTFLGFGVWGAWCRVLGPHSWRFCSAPVHSRSTCKSRRPYCFCGPNCTSLHDARSHHASRQAASCFSHLNTTTASGGGMHPAYLTRRTHTQRKKNASDVYRKIRNRTLPICTVLKIAEA